MPENFMKELPENVMKEIEYWAQEERVDKSMLITEIIKEGLHAWKIDKALQMYKAQRVTLWKAAEIAGISLSEMLAELPKRKIVFHYDLEELREDLEYAHSK